MRCFKYFNATSIEEAITILSKYKEKAKVIAGGTDLLGELKDQNLPMYPEILVNIKTIPGLSYIKEEDRMLKIGALTKLRDIEKNTMVRDKYKALAEAAHAVAYPEIRYMGTIAGNLCQDIRCWYYRSSNNYFHCLRKGGATCYAMAGDNRYHSIFGAVGGCVAVNPSDTAPALVALNARIKTSKRTVDAEDFFKVGLMETTILDVDEIVTEIQVPTPATGTKSAFIKFAIRKTVDFPIVNCAAAITSEAGVVREARICLNAVYNLPYRAKKAEEYIKGKSIDESTAEEAGKKAVEDAIPLTMNKYKVQIAKALVKRAILACR